MSNLDVILTEFLDSEMIKYGLPGYDCSVYCHGQEIYRRYAGNVDKDTLYYVFSNTKVIVCVAALQLYEKGKFLLEDRVDQFFTEMKDLKVKSKNGLKKAKRAMTIRDLFCMTSGLGDGIIDEELGRKIWDENPDGIRPIDLPKYLANIPLEFEPGEQFYYGISHEILAALIEKITGEKFSDYLHKNIFKPLKMNDTGFYPSRLNKEKIARLYRYNNGKEIIMHEEGSVIIPPMLLESASGGLITTVDDYMKFQEALCSGEKLLKRSTINLMRLDQLKGKQRDGYGYTGLGMGYGLGVRTIINQAECGSPVGFGPFGWGGAAGTYGSIDPENEITIFYAQSMFDTDSLRTHNLLRNIIYSALI